MPADVTFSIHLHAHHFRLALEDSMNLRLPGLSNFPADACGDASRLLAEYLRSRGLGDSGIVTGWRRPEMISHAWLTLNGLIVDITADQFAEINDPVIVIESTAWHSAWESEPAKWTAVGVAYYDNSSGADSDFAQLAAAADESLRDEADA